MPKKSFQSNSTLERSPLLSKDLNSSLHSTINPDRLDPARFSDLRVEEESSIRIIIYVIIVIIIGVGAAFLVRNLISNNDSDDKDNEDTTQVTSYPAGQVKAYDINTTAKLDNQAVNASQNAAFVNASLVTVGNPSIDTSDLSVSKISYQKYTTFVRSSFEISGMATGINNAFPQVNVEYEPVTKKLHIQFGDLNSIVQNLKSGTQISATDLVKEIRYDQVDNDFILFLSEDARYAISISGNKLIVDIKTERQYKIDEEVTTTPTDTTTTDPIDTTIPTDTTPTDTNKPTAVTYTNEFSQEKQYIVSNVTGNTIDYNETYYEDYGASFEIAWGSRNNVGDNYVPNASAELVLEKNVYYIDITIENLASYKDFGKIDESKIGIDLSGANFVTGEMLSFENNVLKYRVQLKNKADFRIVTEPTVSGKTQVLALQIKD